MTDTNDTVETYSTVPLIAGVSLTSQYAQLNSIRQRNGYTQTLTYAGGGLSSVTDSYSRSLTFAYANGLLQSVTTPDGLVISFAYTAAGGGDELTTVTYASLPTTSQTYLYENSALPFALTGIIDENGNRYATWAYDSYGRLTSSQFGTGANAETAVFNSDGSSTVTNAFGVADTYKFTLLQNVPKVTVIDRAATVSTAAATEQFTYDSNGYLASQTDWNGDQTTFVNNSHGLPTTIQEAVGSSVTRTTEITYDSTWVHLPATINTTDLDIAFTYDGNGQPLTRTLTDLTTTVTPYSTRGQSRSTTNTWSNSLLASTQTPNGNKTSFGYDSSGALTSITDPLGHITQITAHTAGGLPKTIVDPNNVTTTLAYDGRQHILSKVVSGSTGTYSTRWSYYNTEQLLQETFPDGSLFAYMYDTAHRLTQVNDGDGNFVAYTLDALGDRTTTDIYRNGHFLQWQSSSTFDALGRELVETAGAAQTTTRTYDSNGNVLTVTDGLGHTTTNAYDALNRLGSSTDANNGATLPAYDVHNRIVSVTDANGNKTSYLRDGFGDVIQQLSPDSGTSVFHYDADANLTGKTDALSIVTNQTFDALDRPLTTTYPGDPAENVAYAYDQIGTGFSFSVGRLTSVTDAAGSLTRAYEERGDLTSEIRVNGTTTLKTAYTYDGANRIASMTYPDGTLVTYARDTAGYVSSVSAKPAGASSTTKLATITHEPFGPINGVTYGNGIAESWTFDQSYRPTNITDKLGAASLQNLTYGYDVADNVNSITDAVNSVNSQTLGYDVVNRLISAASGTGGYGTLNWSYDKVGNRLTQEQGLAITNYSYASGTNRLSAIANSTAAFLGPTPRIPGHNDRRLVPSPVVLAANTSNTLPAVRPLIPTQPRFLVLTRALGWPTLLVGLAGVLGFRRRLLQNRLLAILFASALFTGSATILIGCGTSLSFSSAPAPVPSIAITGRVHGGQPPVTGATIQLYAVGTTGTASASTALLRTAVHTDATGSFSITSDYTCPSATTQVYLTATGGNPGLSPGTNNSAIAMMAALGPCGSLSASTFVWVNEVTTIGSLAALYPYMSSVANLGSASSSAAALTTAFALVNEYTNTATGADPGPTLPTGYYASSTEINSLGDSVASCINSAGGVAGDGSACGALFTLATPIGGTAPTDTIQAILDILKNPTLNVSALFDLSPAAAPFQPSLSAAPANWSLPIVGIPAVPIFSIPSGTYTAPETVALSDTTPGAAIYYTTDGSAPTTASNLYSGSITVASSETIQAIAVQGSANPSGIATATYTISTLRGSTITVLTNANGNITGVPSADGVSYVTATYNNANRLASVTGTPLAATYIYDWTGQRYSKTSGGTAATFSYAQGGTSSQRTIMV